MVGEGKFWNVLEFEYIIFFKYPFYLFGQSKVVIGSMIKDPLSQGRRSG